MTLDPADLLDALEVKRLQDRRHLESRNHWRRYLAIPDPPVMDRHHTIERAWERAWERRAMRENERREREIVREGAR